MAMNAPGKHFRVDISLIELFEMFPDEKTAEEWFEKKLWGRAGKPTRCPKCGSRGRIKKYENRKSSPYHCADCRSFFSVRTGTVLSHSRIPLQKWVVGIYLWSTSLKGVSSMRLHRDLKITQKSAWFMAQRLREAWSQSLFSADNLMEGPVEVDETFFGGKEKNKHTSQKSHAGRGIAGKVVVAGAKDRETNTISASVVPGTDKETLHGFIADRASPEAEIITDDHRSYQGLPYEHKTVKHSVSQCMSMVRLIPMALSLSGRC